MQQYVQNEDHNLYPLLEGEAHDTQSSMGKLIQVPSLGGGVLNFLSKAPEISLGALSGFFWCFMTPSKTCQSSSASYVPAEGA